MTPNLASSHEEPAGSDASVCIVSFERDSAPGDDDSSDRSLSVIDGNAVDAEEPAVFVDTELFARSAVLKLQAFAGGKWPGAGIFMP